MKKAGKNSSYVDRDNFPQELRAQPRKSDFKRYKVASNDKIKFNEDDGERQTSHRHQPAKNVVRVQLRRLELFF